MHFASRLGLSDAPSPGSSKAAAPENKNTAPDLIAATLKALTDRVTALETETAALRATVTRNAITADRNVTRNGNAERQRRYRERKKAAG